MNYAELYQVSYSQVHAVIHADSAWIVLLTLASMNLPVLCDPYTGQGHLRSSGKKGQTPKKSGYGTAKRVFGSNFRK